VHTTPHRYTWRVFAGDAAGAVVAALIALPYGLAMASLMGLPPWLGLVTSIATAPVTAALGRNPVLIGGTASATVPFIAHAVSEQGIGGAAKVCLAASVFMMIFCVLRLGRHIQKVPHAVVVGFSCGIGAMMVLSQLSAMLGIRTTGARGSDLLTATWEILRAIGTARFAPIAITLVVIAAACVAARVNPKLPAPLLGLIAALGIAQLFGMHESVVGVFDLKLPAPAAFAWTADDLRSVIPAGLGLAFVASVNLLLTSRVVEHFRGRHQPLKRGDADRELGAYGIANLAAAMFAAPLSVGIPARSLASIRCGATSRISNLLHAVVLLALVALGGGVIARIPLAALAAVTAYVGFGLLEWSTWKRLARMRRLDALAFLSTAISVLATNAVFAVAIGCSFYVFDWALHRIRASERLPIPADKAA
jgi:SulP family sulfate permease